MKFSKLVVVSLLILLATPIFASGIYHNIFDCELPGSGKKWNLSYNLTSAPGGPVSEWYELVHQKETGSEVYNFRLIQDEVVEDANTVLTKYKRDRSANGYGKLIVLKIGDKLYVDARLGNTFQGDLIKTDGLTEIGDNFICK